MNHCIIHFLLKVQYIIWQADRFGQQWERSRAGVPLQGAMWEGVAGMGHDVSHIHLWRPMRGWRWLLHVTLEYLSWIGCVLLLVGCWINEDCECWSPGGIACRGSPGILNIGFNKRSSISSIRLGQVTTSLGHSVMGCREETSVDNCRGMAFRESPWVALGRVICSWMS